MVISCTQNDVIFWNLRIELSKHPGYTCGISGEQTDFGDFKITDYTEKNKILARKINRSNLLKIIKRFI